MLGFVVNALLIQTSTAIPITSFICIGARLKKKSDFKHLLELTLYEKRGLPVCASANVDLFKQLMGDFNQYERLYKVISNSYLLSCQICEYNICDRPYVH